MEQEEDAKEVSVDTIMKDVSTPLMSGHSDVNNNVLVDDNGDVETGIFSFIPKYIDELRREKQRVLDELQRQRDEEQRLMEAELKRKEAEMKRKEAEMKRKEAEMKREKRERKLFKYEDDLTQVVEVDRRQKERIKKRRRERRLLKLEQMKIDKMELEILENERHQSLVTDDEVHDLQNADDDNNDRDSNKECNDTSSLEESPSYSTFNARDLFDFSTLDADHSGDGDRETRKVVKRETVKLQRLVLGKRGVHVEVDQYVMLEVNERLKRRSPVKLETLKLNIIKDCNSVGAAKGNTPSMPLLRLEMLESVFFILELYNNQKFYQLEILVLN
jgi:hypothetical protein